MNFLQVLNPSVEFRMSFLKTSHKTCQKNEVMEVLSEKKDATNKHF